MTDRRRILILLLTAVVAVPAGWLAARSLERPINDLVWATIVFTPEWIALRAVTGDLQWNALFFGYLAPILAFETMFTPRMGPLTSVVLIALAPLLVYGIIWLTMAVMYSGVGIAWLLREVSDPDMAARRLGRRIIGSLQSGIRSMAWWYMWWLAGAAIGGGFGAGMRAAAQAIGIPPGATLFPVAARVILGGIAGLFTWIILNVSGLTGQKADWLQYTSPRANHPD